MGKAHGGCEAQGVSPHVCPNCGQFRWQFDAVTGFCKVCRRRDALTAEQSRFGALWALMTPAERVLYDETDADVESTRLLALPVRGGRYRPDAPAEAAFILGGESYAREAALLATLHRQIRAAQRRRERVESKVRARAEGAHRQTPCRLEADGKVKAR